jgi:Calcineurin-like phosphoesterase
VRGSERILARRWTSRTVIKKQLRHGARIRHGEHDAQRKDADHKTGGPRYLVRVAVCRQVGRRPPGALVPPQVSCIYGTMTVTNLRVGSTGRAPGFGTLMRFSVLHISDLHRDLNDEINNKWLLDSLEKDFNQFEEQEPKISRPMLCIVSGDLVYGVKPGVANAETEIKRQYRQAEEFLVGLADRFFGGKRDRLVLLPGNHDVFFDSVMASALKIAVPSEPEKKAELVAELFRPNSRLRWSWRSYASTGSSILSVTRDVLNTSHRHVKRSI